jgi:ppGpp synthetase/RelA/SpoT-type nucleotidyltranferase
MAEQEQIKKHIQEQLEKVNRRLKILDMIEEKLFRMRELAQRVIDEEITDEEIEEINKQVQDLGEQVRLLDSEVTLLS